MAYITKKKKENKTNWIKKKDNKTNWITKKEKKTNWITKKKSSKFYGYTNPHK